MEQILALIVEYKHQGTEQVSETESEYSKPESAHDSKNNREQWILPWVRERHPRAQATPQRRRHKHAEVGDNQTIALYQFC